MSARTGLGRVVAVMAVLAVLLVPACSSAPDTGPRPTPATAPRSPTSGLPQDPGPGWALTAESVGLAPLGLSCASLPAYDGPSKPARGTAISDRLVLEALDLSAGGITIERSCLRPTDIGQGLPVLTTKDNNLTFQPGADLVTIRDSEIDGSALSQKAAALSTGFIGIADLQRNYVHHLGSGLALMTTGTSLDALVEQNYVTDLISWGDPATDGNHSDAFTVRDFSNAHRSGRQAVVRNNRFDCDSPSATGAFFVQTYAGPIDNLLIEGNLLEGGGYQVGLEAKNFGYSNIRATNNRLSGTGYGSVYTTGGSGFTQWQDNYRYDPAGIEARGEAVPRP